MIISKSEKNNKKSLSNINNINYEKKIFDKIKKIEKTLPKFPDGRINYTNSKKSLVLTVFIRYKEKILILKRSNKVSTYKGKWSVITGYLDEPKSLFDKIIEEISEELGIFKDIILSFKYGNPFEFFDNKLEKIWIIHPAIVELKSNPKIILNWEHDEYKWITPDDLKKLDIVPNLNISLNKVLN